MYTQPRPYKFYLLTSLFVIAGWLWFLWSFFASTSGGATVCLFKNITGHPCPACGSTTSLEMIVRGDFAGALGANPLGYLMAAGLLVLPVWVLVDFFSRKRTIYNALMAFDRRMREKPLILLFILLPVLLNWIWNWVKA